MRKLTALLAIVVVWCSVQWVYSIDPNTADGKREAHTGTYIASDFWFVTTYTGVDPWLRDTFEAGEDVWVVADYEWETITDMAKLLVEIYPDGSDTAVHQAIIDYEKNVPKDIGLNVDDLPGPGLYDMMAFALDKDENSLGLSKIYTDCFGICGSGEFYYAFPIFAEIAIPAGMAAIVGVAYWRKKSGHKEVL